MSLNPPRGMKCLFFYGSRRNKSCPRQPAKNSSARNQIRNPPEPTNPASTNATAHSSSRGGRGEAADHQQVVEVDLTLEEGGSEAGGSSSSSRAPRPPPPPYCVAAQSNAQSSQAALNFAQVRSGFLHYVEYKILLHFSPKSVSLWLIQTCPSSPFSNCVQNSLLLLSYYSKTSI